MRKPIRVHSRITSYESSPGQATFCLYCAWGLHVTHVGAECVIRGNAVMVAHTAAPFGADMARPFVAFMSRHVSESQEVTEALLGLNGSAGSTMAEAIPNLVFRW